MPTTFHLQDFYMSDFSQNNIKTILINLRRTVLFYPVIIALFTLAFFFEPLFINTGQVLSKFSNDIFGYFIYTLEFGFTQLKEGNLSLWNPHIFSGTPFLGNFQSALLYPFNILFLFLPVHTVINITIVFHVFLFGFFMYMWGLRKNLHPFACFYLAITAMFSGPYFLRIYTGHLGILYTIAWAPLIFIAIDGFALNGSWMWYFMGIAGVCMQILGGSPQYVFYTGIMAAVYALFCLFKEKNIGLIFFPLIIYSVAVILCAVQVVPGFAFARETLRSNGLSYIEASSFSFPAGNIITTVVPDFFGNMASVSYWGKANLWETSSFIGLGTFIFAIFGLLYGDKKKTSLLLAMTLISLMLALGKYTPLFDICYKFLPFFNTFRCTARFILFSTLFFLLIAAIGFDAFLKSKMPARNKALSLLLISITLAVTTLIVGTHITFLRLDDLWRYLLGTIVKSNEIFFNGDIYNDADFIMTITKHSLFALLRVSVFFAVISLFLYLGTFFRWAKAGVFVVLLFEILYFAKTFSAAFDAQMTRAPDLKRFLEAHPGDYRTLTFGNPNAIMWAGGTNITGYDAIFLRRYAEFIAFTQDLDPDTIKDVHIKNPSKLFELIRCRFAVRIKNPLIKREVSDLDFDLLKEFNNPMPHLKIMRKWKVIENRNSIFAELKRSSFDFHKTVILEKDPELSGVPQEIFPVKKDAVSIVNSSTDHLTIEANLTTPGILLVTDPYSSGWRIKPIQTFAQEKYQIIPAYYALMAVPLKSGSHRFVLEYEPKGFTAAKIVSLLSLSIFFCSFIVFAKKIGLRRLKNA